MHAPSKSSISNSLLAFLFTVLSMQNAYSAPGTLPGSPLFLSTLVEPNVFFTLDDSGSMLWGLMVDEGIGGFTVNSGTPEFDNGDPENAEYYGYYAPSGFSYKYRRKPLPPSDGTVTAWNDLWIFRNHIGNKNYYNPDTRYQPWVGTDVNGLPMYDDADPTEAWENPNNTDTASGDTFINLTQDHTFTEGDNEDTTMWIPTYYTWSDTDNDGVIEPSDSHTEVKIAVGSAEMTNFANWFVYYRSRINATKAIIGRTINNTDTSRMGMAVFNDGHQNNTETMSQAANKSALLTSLYAISPSGSTPARITLETVGNYFKTTDAEAEAPILPVAEGGECQQNFNMLMSDGFWNGSTNPDVGDADSDGDTDFDGGLYADKDSGTSNTLADVAMSFYEDDLRPLLANNVPTQAGIDEANHQHLVTYSIAFGISGTLDADIAPDHADFDGWPTPVANDLTTVDDMRHAAYNGRGKFLSADNPEQLQASIDAAISDIAERTGSVAAVSISSGILNTESVVYRVEFNSNRWQGNVYAYSIIDPGTGVVATPPKWDAASILTSRNITSIPRNIITYNNSLAVPGGVAFQWSDISTAMQNDLRTNASGTVDSTPAGETIGQARLNYLRGDRSNEGSGEFFRNRVSILGDIINSSPVFVGESLLAWPDTSPFPTGQNAYSNFKNSTLDRTKMLYVGANDGMLHGFDAETGKELFGYIPGKVSSTNSSEGLHYLTDPNYVHQFYVDLTPTLSDIFIDATWKTVLVGGMRGGGRGIYALDVTNPSLFKETNASDVVLWEFTDEDDADLGYTYSQPVIAYANNNRWVAIFGNGYNDLGSGEAALFIVDIAEGADGTWQATDYRKISTGVGSPANPNGLATPALADINGDGTVDRVYAGDLQGNMWAFDLSDTNSNNWNSAFKQGQTPKPLFSTPITPASGTSPAIIQRITVKPELARHPTQSDSNSPSNAPNIMVYFGTGQYLVDADKTNNEVQSFYGIWDKGVGAKDVDDLIEQTFITKSIGKTLTSNTVDYSVNSGWYFNLPEAGERVVTPAIARGDVILFATFVPVQDPCSTGGFGFIYATDQATGSSPSGPQFDTNEDGIVDEKDNITVMTDRREGKLVLTIKGNLMWDGGDNDPPDPLPPLDNIHTGRLSWQELL